MKVGELIKELEKLDKELEVRLAINDGYNFHTDIKGVVVEELVELGEKTALISDYNYE